MEDFTDNWSKDPHDWKEATLRMVKYEMERLRLLREINRLSNGDLKDVLKAWDGKDRQ